MRKTRTDPKSFDHTFPCQHCGYAIPPRELLRTDGEHVLRPKCGRESEYIKRE